MQTFHSIHERLAPELRLMNDIIDRYLHTSNPLMNKVVTTYLQTKGRQMRRCFPHDFVDETALRRGLPTVNAAWGNHIAVLVGDFFVSNALAAGIATGHLSIISALSDLGKELSLGEIDQISNVRELNFDEESYFSAIGKKTASLFVNCARMGAEAAGAAPDIIPHLVEYARLMGLCFQIKDDILDYVGSDSIGKPTGNDLREGKVSLPLLYALQAAPVNLSEPIRNILRRGALSSPEIHDIVGFAISHGGIDYAYDRMRLMQRQGQTSLERLPDNPVREDFADLFEFIISRDK